MRPSLWKAQLSLWNTRPSFWGFKRKLKVWPCVCAITQTMLSQSQTMLTMLPRCIRVNGILAKLRYYVSTDILKTIYYALLDWHMRYACQIWGQSHSERFNMIHSIQNKALRIKSFKKSMERSEPLYQNPQINKLKNIIFKTCLFVYINIINMR